MTKPPKTAASPLERATIYTLSVWAHREMVPKHMTDAFLAGYTEGQRDAYASAEGLVDVIDEVANNIGTDALQTEYEPGWMDTVQAVKTIEMTQRLQRKWFTELKEAIKAFQRAKGES